MKKILCILTIFLLASCNCKENEQVPEISKHNVKHSMYKGQVKHYIYEGHKYLSFGSKYRSMIHDPDCSCHNNY